jgi:hypothetical protein
MNDLDLYRMTDRMREMKRTLASSVGFKDIAWCWRVSKQTGDWLTGKDGVLLMELFGQPVVYDETLELGEWGIAFPKADLQTAPARR